MELIPALDLRKGRCVRLSQGDPNRETCYETDPSKIVAEFVACGARKLHLVNMDGAFGEESDNPGIIEGIVRDFDINVELGGGIRTLEVRMRRHNANGLGLAEWFQAQPQVKKVLYPGLPSHPDHETAAALMDGFGGMLGVVLKGGGKAANAFTKNLQLAIMAPSLGGVETLVSQPRYTSHADMTAAERTAVGVSDGFVRISAGIEDLCDLVTDFGRALAQSDG